MNYVVCHMLSVSVKTRLTEETFKSDSCTISLLKKKLTNKLTSRNTDKTILKKIRLVD